MLAIDYHQTARQVAYRLNDVGVIDSFWHDTLFALNIYPSDHWLAEKDSVWAFGNRQGRKWYEGNGPLPVDSLYIGYLSHGLQHGKWAALSLPFQLQTPDWTDYSSFNIKSVSPSGDLLYEVAFINSWSLEDPRFNKESYLYHIKLNAHFNKIESFKLLDSFSRDAYNVGNMPRGITISPRSQYAYIGVEHIDKTWIDRRDEPQYNTHYKLWQYHLSTGKKHHLRLRDSSGTVLPDTILSNPYHVLSPHGQVYISYWLDSLRFRYPYKYNIPFFAQVDFPDKPKDSAQFRLKQYGEYRIPGIRDNFLHIYDFHDSKGLNPPRIDYDVRSNCKSKGLRIENHSEDLFTSYKWYFMRYGDSLLVDSAEGFEPKFDLPKSGKYLVKAMGQSATGFRNWRWDYFEYLKVPKAAFDTNLVVGCQWSQLELQDQTLVDTTNEKTGSSWHWEFFLNGEKVKDRKCSKP